MDPIAQQVIAEDHKNEARKWKAKYELIIDFLEMTEALTKDKETASRIRTLLNQEGIWK